MTHKCTMIQTVQITIKPFNENGVSNQSTKMLIFFYIPAFFLNRQRNNYCVFHSIPGSSNKLSKHQRSPLKFDFTIKNT